MGQHRHPSYVDLTGAVHYSDEYVVKLKAAGSTARRFCDDCGSLRQCWIHLGVVRCAACSKRANVPTIRDAFLSAASREDELRRKRNKSYRGSYRTALALTPRYA